MIFVPEMILIKPAALVFRHGYGMKMGSRGSSR